MSQTGKRRFVWKPAPPLKKKKAIFLIAWSGSPNGLCFQGDNSPAVKAGKSSLWLCKLACDGVQSGLRLKIIIVAAFGPESKRFFFYPWRSKDRSHA